MREGRPCSVMGCLPDDVRVVRDGGNTIGRNIRGDGRSRYATVGGHGREVSGPKRQRKKKRAWVYTKRIVYNYCRYCSRSHALAATPVFT